jgi:hypothetical protein
MGPTEIVPRRRAAPLTLHKGQMEVYRNTSRMKVVVAGRRWGKTQLAKVAIINAARKPKQLIWYVAPTYGMAKGIMWYELLESIPRNWIKGKPNETALIIKLKNGTRIELKGADKPDTLRGLGIHFLVLDEFQDIKEETWKKVLRPTLASTGGKALIIGTPKSFNLLYQLWKLGQNPRNRELERWTSWQFPTITSPFIPKSEIDEARADMDPKSFKQEFEASFETMSGRVYYPFDRRIHVGKYPIDPSRPVMVGQDFNIDPMSSVLIQKQDNGDLWAVGEIVLKPSNVEEVTDELERRLWRWNPKQVIIYPDPAGGSRQHARGESSLDIFRERGFKDIRYRKKHPLIQDRVNAVNRMLMSADGQVRLYIDQSCRYLIESLEQTIYKAGTPDIDKTAGKEHMTDALGYPIEFEFPVRKIKLYATSV